jgi:hypothetical protein
VYYGLAQGHSPYYHARYYDPSLARFISPDSIVPGASPGAGGAASTLGVEQGTGLTVDFHLLGLTTDTTNNKLAPFNPQALNRYSYALNDPLRYIDPTGYYPAEPEGGRKVPNLYDWFPKRFQHPGGSKEVADDLRWPKGAADEADAMRNLDDPDFLKDVEEKGWTPDEVDKVAEGYEEQARANPNNPAAAPRARYLRELARRLRARAAERERSRGQNEQNYRSLAGAMPWLVVIGGTAVTAYAYTYIYAGGALIPGGGCHAGINCSMLR